MKKVEMFEALKGLLETYGTKLVLEGMVEATENLVGASNAETEHLPLGAARMLALAAKRVVRAEELVEAELSSSVEVLIGFYQEQEEAAQGGGE